MADHTTAPTRRLRPRRFREANGGELVRRFCDRCFAEHTVSIDGAITANMMPGQGCKR